MNFADFVAQKIYYVEVHNIKIRYTGIHLNRIHSA